MRQPGIRTDIQALRALAVVGVIAFHTGLTAPGGFLGVDIFFAISGYLILGLIAKNFDATSSQWLWDFWARRIRRLLPACGLVICVSAIAAALIAPTVESGPSWDLLAAATGISNFYFSGLSNDYFGEAQVSPALHYWSLAVEEQFYVLAPILVIAFAAIGQRVAPKRLLNSSAVVLQSLGFVLVLSATFALASQSDAISAFYHPFARAWEFALGGLAALTATPERLSGSAGRVLTSSAWTGLVLLILLASPPENGIGLFNLLAILLTVTIMWVGRRPSGVAVAVPAAQRFVVWIGDHSYSLYLWHWPVLWIFANLRRESAEMLFALQEAVAAVVLSAGLAVLTKRLVEDPIRFSTVLAGSTARSFVAGGLGLSLCIGTVAFASDLPPLGYLGGGPVRVAPKVLFGDGTQASADAWLSELIATYAPKVGDTAAPNRPSLDQLANDFPAMKFDGCFIEMRDPEPSQRCFYDRKKHQQVIATFGDSYMFQYFTPIRTAARSLGYTFMPRTRSGCPPLDVRLVHPTNQYLLSRCPKFYRLVLAELIKVKPKLVFLATQPQTDVIDPLTGKLATSVAKAKRIWASAYRGTIRKLVSHGIHVVVLRASTSWGVDMRKCLLMGNTQDCKLPLSEVLISPDYDIAITDGVVGSDGIDLTQAICGPEFCEAVRGDIVVMRDHSHMNNSYAAALSPLFIKILQHYKEVWAI